MTCITQQIKPDFDKVIAYSQGIREPKTDGLLEQWYEAKRDIIDLWGGELIREYGPVSFELDESEKRKRLDEFITTIASNFDNEPLADFLETIRDDFFKNHLSHEYHIYDDDRIIPKGTKVVKAFKYFETNDKLLAELQNQASMIIQEDKVSGVLCFSVHPLDYLSSSENTYHWRSCHSLDGAYRAGNLSYMLDKSTIVCYLKKPYELCKLPNFPEDVLWNSKKWRMLLFLEDEREALFAGRQYPFFSSTALDLVLQYFLDCTKKHGCHWSRWYNDYIIDFPRENAEYRRDSSLHGGRHVCLNGRIYAATDLIVDANNSRHFNDLLYSSCYVPYYCWTYYPHNDRRRLHFSIGAEVPCLCCGEDSIPDLDDGGMYCFECEGDCGQGVTENYRYCACCERRTHRSNLRWMYPIDAYICDDCYETETRHCDNCGDFWYSCDIQYDRETEKNLCPWCREQLKRKQLAPNQNDDDIWLTLPF
jgi:hypothetical protein